MTHLALTLAGMNGPPRWVLLPTLTGIGYTVWCAGRYARARRAETEDE